MGVSGLLPQLKEIQGSVSLEMFRGKRLAIDSYAWLHRSVISCSWELAQGLETSRYIHYFNKRISMLRHFGVIPYFVFDGDHFGSKSDTELERSKRRLENKAKAYEYLSRGDKRGATEFFMKCVDVTPAMAKSIIELLKIEKIQYVVAPYEADAQMVYLEKLGLVDGIISEDSDLLIFGSQCLLTKLNDYGECIEIRRKDFKKCRSVPIGLMNDSQLRMVACLSGCDYTSGIPNIGIVKAFRLVKRYNNIKKCLLNLKLEGKVKVPQDFELEYDRADISFQYQRVFDPIKEEMATLNELPSAFDDEQMLSRCIGPLYDASIHKEIAKGNLDPISKEALHPREDMSKIRECARPSTSSTLRINSFFTSTPVQRVATRFNSMPNFATSYDTQGNTGVAKHQTTSTQIPLTAPSKTPCSPTSRRRALFHGERAATDPSNGTPSISKFFLRNTTGSTGSGCQPRDSNAGSSQRLTPPISSYQALPNTNTNTSQKSETGISKNDICADETAGCNDYDVCSSEFDLSDPEDDNPRLANKRQAPLEEDKENRLTATATTKANYNTDTDEETAHQCKRQRTVNALYERYGFTEGTGKKTKAQTVPVKRPPLTPLVQFENREPCRPKTVTVKSKGSISKHLTLDQFIYRE